MQTLVAGNTGVLTVEDLGALLFNKQGDWIVRSLRVTIGSGFTVIASKSVPNGWTVTPDDADEPTELTVGVPAGEFETLQIIYYGKKRSFATFFSTTEAAVPTTPPAAPTPTAITSSRVVVQAPNPLLTGYEFYRPEVYDPIEALWKTGASNLEASESAIIANLVPDTANYRVRFVGIPESGLGDEEVIGTQSGTFSTLSLEDDPDAVPPIEECDFHPTGKSVSAEYKEHLQGSVTTRALLMKITRQDGEVFAFTGAVRDIDGSDITQDGDVIPELDGVLFKAKYGLSPTGLASSFSTDANNMEAQAILDDDSITERDLHAGLFDGAEVLLCEVNYADLSMGIMKHGKGKIGKVEWNETMFTGETMSLSDRFKNPVLENTSVTCRCRFTDERCGVDPDGQDADGNDITATGTIDTVDSAAPRRTFTTSDITAYPVDYFRFGRVTITNAGSPNYGLTRKVRTSNGDDIILAETFPFELEVGDTFSVIAGCDKRIETCGERFNNQVRFQGEPWLPGPTIWQKEKKQKGD